MHKQGLGVREPCYQDKYGLRGGLGLGFRVRVVVGLEVGVRLLLRLGRIC